MVTVLPDFAVDFALVGALSNYGIGSHKQFYMKGLRLFYVNFNANTLEWTAICNLSISINATFAN